MKKIHYLSPLLVLIIMLNGCLGIPARDKAPISRTGFAFDTVITITVYDSTNASVLDHCLDLCEQYESLFSATLEGSEVWEINHAGGQPTAVSYDTASLIQSAQCVLYLRNGRSRNRCIRHRLQQTMIIIFPLIRHSLVY